MVWPTLGSRTAKEQEQEQEQCIKITNSEIFFPYIFHTLVRHVHMFVYAVMYLFINALSVQNDPLSFRSQRNFRLIADFARDLLAAPASQAFVERIFSVSGMLTQGLARDESLPQTKQSSAGSG